MQEQREVKIEKKLSELLALSDENNTEIAKQIGVSVPSLTAYRNGETRPSFKTLVAMAEVFNVSLDHLVFGDADDDEVNVGPAIRYLDRSFQMSQLQQSQHSSMMHYIGLRISEKIDEEIEEFLSETTTQGLLARTMRYPELLMLEKYSTTTKLFLKSFHRLLDPKTETPGQFFNTVANNLSNGYEYQYLLPDSANDDWESVIDSFRRMLVDTTISRTTFHNNCEFRITDNSSFGECGLYKINMQQLKIESPMSHDIINENDYCHDGWFGYVMEESKKSRGGMIIDGDHVNSSIQFFDRLWDDAEPI